ncbi:MAG TPA: hypothetical protein VGI06_00940, partial [Acidimicrobiales bacterium]
MTRRIHLRFALVLLGLVLGLFALSGRAWANDMPPTDGGGCGSCGGGMSSQPTAPAPSTPPASSSPSTPPSDSGVTIIN